MCTLCEAEEESQTHLLSCKALSSYSVINSDNTPVYEDIYLQGGSYWLDPDGEI